MSYQVGDLVEIVGYAIPTGLHYWEQPIENIRHSPEGGHNTPYGYGHEFTGMVGEIVKVTTNRLFLKEHEYKVRLSDGREFYFHQGQCKKL